ncbi:hypothetical protein M0804_002412 [Polistes exclamans]|nr:hypothetical protein M0804_002412 [Polistes exclamans]
MTKRPPPPPPPSPTAITPNSNGEQGSERFVDETAWAYQDTFARFVKHASWESEKELVIVVVSSSSSSSSSSSKVSVQRWMLHVKKICSISCSSSSVKRVPSDLCTQEIKRKSLCRTERRDKGSAGRNNAEIAAGAAHATAGLSPGTRSPTFDLAPLHSPPPPPSSSPPPSPLLPPSPPLG